MQLQAGQYEFTARINEKYYYGILRPNIIPMDIIENIKLTNINLWKNKRNFVIKSYKYINIQNYNINILDNPELFESYQPYRLTHIAEISYPVVEKIGIPYYDLKGYMTSLGFLTQNDIIYSNRPFISLNESIKPDEPMLNEYENAIVKLKFMAKTIIDVYTFTKGNQLDGKHKSFTSPAVNLTKVNDYYIKGKNGKLIALATGNKITNKLGSEKFSVDKPGNSVDDLDNIDIINKNCIWFFDARFIKYMDGKLDESNNMDYWNDKCINLMDYIEPTNPNSKKLYEYFINDYSALSPEHYEDLKEIVNELCKKLYGNNYESMKDKLCIKFHNFNGCKFKILHMHMGPDSNYYNYEVLNRHNIIRDFKNLLIEHAFFGLSRPNFTFDGMYTSKFCNYMLYI